MLATLRHTPLQEQDAHSTLSTAAFHAYVVLDFEATCERGRRIPDPEIIEFPMVIVDSESGASIAEFQRYVQPVLKPRLSDFCTELTGITQATVNAAQTFPFVFREALEFLHSHGFGDEAPYKSFLFVTCGDWDLQTMLPIQLRISAEYGTSLQPPPSFYRWCNIKKLMQRLLPSACASRRIRDIPDMLAVYNLELRGRHHSGIDDCRNIATVLNRLVCSRCLIEPTASVQPPHGCARPISAQPAPASAVTAGMHGSLPTASSREGAAGGGGRRRPTKRKVDAACERPLVDVLPGGDPAKDVLGAADKDIAESAAKDMGLRRLLVAYSKALSRILRHDADRLGISISSAGYVLLEEVLRHKPFATDPDALVRVAFVVLRNEKQRFKMAYDLNKRVYIRANQGHTLRGVNPELRRITDPTQAPVAIHGTYYSAWAEICKCGYLSTMGRQHIHFARGLPDAEGVISGMRGNAEVLLALDVPRVLRDGVELWESANGVLLTPGAGTTGRLPLSYVASATDRRTGEALLF
ncbi:putative Exonuclease RNA 2' phosphotransferase Tpt1 KptA family [Trypanosoma vivax]|uniref:2'-phosphotransferase n=1 Tax=Trypanosoma vivax (strain Y486) TaxID=1055687 RepID=G0UB95_TRYVY|nr:putative Exonuclease RNA 2' phosphotransferase Tpt1 KptA family [Trypanosoma vivax]CCC53082.1 putative phosphotransferase [Trypanosoma vivax Y486]